MSSDGSQSDEVLEGESIKGPLQTTGTLDSVVNIFHCWVGPSLIIVSNPGVLLVEDGLVLLEALQVGIIDVLSIRSKRSRRRSVGVGHFVWRMGWWCKRQWLMLLLSAHDRHAIIWSSLPLPWDSSNCQSDKPWIFSTHLFQCSLVCGLFLSFIWLILVLYLSLFVIQPTLISYRPTWSSMIVSQLIHSIFISPMSIIGLWSVCKTCPKHVCI